MIVNAYGSMDTINYDGQFSFFIDNIRTNKINIDVIFNEVLNKLRYLAKNNKLYRNSGHIRECTLVVYDGTILIDSYEVNLESFRGKLTIR